MSNGTNEKLYICGCTLIWDNSVLSEYDYDDSHTTDTKRNHCIGKELDEQSWREYNSNVMPKRNETNRKRTEEIG